MRRSEGLRITESYSELLDSFLCDETLIDQQSFNSIDALSQSAIVFLSPLAAVIRTWRCVMMMVMVAHC